MASIFSAPCRSDIMRTITVWMFHSCRSSRKDSPRGSVRQWTPQVTKEVPPRVGTAAPAPYRTHCPGRCSSPQTSSGGSGRSSWPARSARRSSSPLWNWWCRSLSGQTPQTVPSESRGEDRCVKNSGSSALSEASYFLLLELQFSFFSSLWLLPCFRFSFLVCFLLPHLSVWTPFGFSTKMFVCPERTFPFLETFCLFCTISWFVRLSVFLVWFYLSEECHSVRLCLLISAKETLNDFTSNSVIWGIITKEEAT